MIIIVTLVCLKYILDSVSNYTYPHVGQNRWLVFSWTQKKIFLFSFVHIKWKWMVTKTTHLPTFFKTFFVFVFFAQKKEHFSNLRW